MNLKAKNGIFYLHRLFQELCPSYVVSMAVTSNVSCVNDSQFLTLSLEISLIAWNVKN